MKSYTLRTSFFNKMNKFNNIIIIGTTGSGKSMLAGIYLESHPEATLIDSLHIGNKISERMNEFTECDTLIIDEIPIPPCQILSDILKFRIMNEKKNVILTQSTRDISNLISEDINPVGTLLTLIYGADLKAFSSFLDIMLRIRSDRPIWFNLWKRRTNDKICIEKQNRNLTLDQEEWNSLLNDISFWKMVLFSDLQCLVMSDNGEDTENGRINWNLARQYLEKLSNNDNTSPKLKKSFREILSWVDTASITEYQLGINFISSHTVK